MLVHGGKPEPFLKAIITARLSAVIYLQKKKRRKNGCSISGQQLLCVSLAYFEAFFCSLPYAQENPRSYLHQENFRYDIASGWSLVCRYKLRSGLRQSARSFSMSTKLSVRVSPVNSFLPQLSLLTVPYRANTRWEKKENMNVPLSQKKSA